MKEKAEIYDYGLFIGYGWKYNNLTTNFFTTLV